MPWTEPPANPQGLVLYGTWKVGPQLGTGEFSVVHEIVDSKTRRPVPDFVVKLAKTANPNLSKKKFTEASINANTLNGERTRYKFQFRGTGVVPAMPDMAQGIQCFQGNTSGTFIVIPMHLTALESNSF